MWTTDSHTKDRQISTLNRHDFDHTTLPSPEIYNLAFKLKTVLLFRFSKQEKLAVKVV